MDEAEDAEGAEAKGVKVEADVEVVMDVSIGDLGDGSGGDRDILRRWGDAELDWDAGGRLGREEHNLGLFSGERETGEGVVAMVEVVMLVLVLSSDREMRSSMLNGPMIGFSSLLSGVPFVPSRTPSRS